MAISIRYRGLWLGAILLAAVVFPVQSRCEADSAASDDGWRRTADGWEYRPIGSALAQPFPIARDLVTAAPWFPASAHPAAWAGLQFALSLLALAMFSRPEE